MLQIVIGIVVAGLIWRSVGVTLAAKGHHHPVGYQFLAVTTFLSGGVVGAFVAVLLADPRSDSSLVVVLIVNFAVPPDRWRGVRGCRAVVGGPRASNRGRDQAGEGVGGLQPVR